LLGLLGFDLQLQNLIVEKIQWFMSKIAHDHRVISNLYNLGITKELEDMWCNFDVGHDCKPILDYKYFIHYLSTAHFHVDNSFNRFCVVTMLLIKLTNAYLIILIQQMWVTICECSTYKPMFKFSITCELL
jgi:hypothetical protein